MGEEWCREQLENLKIDEKRNNALNEIHTRVSKPSEVESVVNVRILNAPEIYKVVEDKNNSEQTDIAIDIIAKCMNNLTIKEDKPNILQRAMDSPNAPLREKALKFLLSEVKSNPKQLQFSDDLLIKILLALREEECQVGATAVQLLEILLEPRLDQPSIQQVLLALLSENALTRCRLYELAVKLSVRSSSTMQKVQFLLDNSVLELENVDILMHVNILEILVPLAEQNHGLLYLESKELFELLTKRLISPEAAMEHIVVPGIMKFFGRIGCMQPEKIIVDNRILTQCLFDCFQSVDSTILGIAFDTFANLATTNQGKLLLEKHHSAAVTHLLENFGDYLHNLTSELKNRAFCALEIVFTTDAKANPQISEILYKWFVVLIGNNNNMQILLEFCKNPFPEIKVSCLGFIRALCLHDWGITSFKNTAGFLEFLLDRKIEFDKDAKYAKYELVKILADSNIFEIQIHLQLRKYINEGPYYVEPLMDVATEGQ